MRISHNFLKAGRELGVLLRASAMALVGLPAFAGSGQEVPTVVATLRTDASSTVQQSRAAKAGAGTPSLDVLRLSQWIAVTGDNGSSNFIVVDKRAAQVHVFGADTRLLASSAVLLGAALGDDSVPGIGLRPMAQIQVHERTTPAGRFVGERGRNASGEDVIWVDYDAAVSMHRVRLTKASERRAQRLASPTASDNRISYGCINVPVAFYESHVQTAFARTQAIIYVLPDAKSVQEVFGPFAAASQSAILGRSAQRSAR